MTATIDQLFGSRTALIVEGVTADVPVTGFTRYTLLDRGSYEFVELREPFTDIAARASQLTGRSLAVAEARVVRLAPGDYILAHHGSLHDDLPIECIVDLSPSPVPAEVHYRRRGHVFFRVPCVPNTLSIVELGPTVTRNHTYVSKRQSGIVTRLVLLLR